jgi:hypothetical protein
LEVRLSAKFGLLPSLDVRVQGFPRIIVHGAKRASLNHRYRLRSGAYRATKEEVTMSEGFPE